MDPLSIGAEPTRDTGMLSQEYVAGNAQDFTVGMGANWNSDSPITADCFLPPRTSCPKAWQRVPVAPVPGLRRQLRIWKRVGGQVAEPGQGQYDRAMSELERQGEGSRKRARRARHMQAWSDARWDSRVEEGRDGKQDLVEARGMIIGGTANCATWSNKVTPAMVSAAEQEATTPTNSNSTKPSTFSEESLKWVPRKRHNSRWPIESKK